MSRKKSCPPVGLDVHWSEGSTTEEEIIEFILLPIAAIVSGCTMITVTTVAVLRFNLKKKELETRGSDPELGRVVDTLRDDLDDTRGQLAEMQERLDFAERMLTSGRAAQEDRSG